MYDSKILRNKEGSMNSKILHKVREDVHEQYMACAQCVDWDVRGFSNVITDPQELADCLAWYDGEGKRLGGTDGVWLEFPQKYGHSYILNLDVQDGYIYLWRGYQGHEKQITFFRDNGLIGWLEGRKGGGL